jgi:hypothetical protein
VSCQASQCQWIGPLKDFKLHAEDHLIKICKTCNLSFNGKPELEQHLSSPNSKCKEEKQNECIFKMIGCMHLVENNLNNTNLSASTMDVSFQDGVSEQHSVEDHLILLYKYIEEQFKKVWNRLGGLNESSFKVEDSEKSESNSTKQLSYYFENRFLSVNNPNTRKDSNDSSNNLSDEGLGSSSSISFRSDSVKQEENFLEILKYDSNEPNLSNQKSDALHSIIDTLDKNHTKLIGDISRMALKLSIVESENRSLKEKMNECALKVSELENKICTIQCISNSFEDRLSFAEKASYDGLFIWKITHFTEKLNQSRMKSQSFFSAPFYSHRYGYKMCLRIYLNGDGAGKDTHISLFIVLLKGEYDELLEWPFLQKITFILINATKAQPDFIDSFVPDRQSTSFAKPINQANIASGLPLFCSHGKILNGGFLKDDVLYVKATVDSK